MSASVRRWRLDDGTEQFTVEINPSSMDDIHSDHDLLAGALSIVDGWPTTHTPAPPTQTSFSGVTRTQAFLEALQRWYAKDTPIEITDHLGRLFTVLFTDLQLAPAGHRNAPWRHTYTARILVLARAQGA